MWAALQGFATAARGAPEEPRPRQAIPLHGQVHAIRFAAARRAGGAVSREGRPKVAQGDRREPWGRGVACRREPPKRGDSDVPLGRWRPPTHPARRGAAGGGLPGCPNWGSSVHRATLERFSKVTVQLLRRVVARGYGGVGAGPCACPLRRSGAGARSQRHPLAAAGGGHGDPPLHVHPSPRRARQGTLNGYFQKKLMAVAAVAGD